MFLDTMQGEKGTFGILGIFFSFLRERERGRDRTHKTQDLRRNLEKI